MSNQISVALATFNGEKYIKEQIDSILKQSLLPEEIVICDDHSIDNTISIIEEYNNPIFKIYRNEKSIGVIENFKKAVGLSIPGNLIALADQDDIWHTKKLEILYHQLLAYKNATIPVIAYSDLTLVDENKMVLNESFWNELNHHHHEHCLATLLFGNFITGHSILMNAKMKEYFLAKPKDAILHDVWIAFIANCFGKALKIDQPLALYRQHSQNLNYNLNFKKPSLQQERWKKLKMIFVKNNYLEEEFKIASAFYINYKKDLSQEQLLLFEKFLQAEKKSFLFKYLLLKKYFKHHWIK
jgi:glycosyltransferase involved in cell wall biosynthesis